jgi:H/ACA ribonucleoprotein complex subunit 1
MDEGMNPSSFTKESKFYMDPMKLLPASRFTQEGQKAAGGARGGRGGGERSWPAWPPSYLGLA